MSAPEDRQPAAREFDELLASHANRDLTGTLELRLRELAAGDPERERDLRAIDRLHSTFARERAVMLEAARPADPAEEADETYQRLQRVAARVAEDLKSQQFERPEVRTFDAPRKRAPWLWLAAAAVLVVALVFAFQGDRPPLQTGDPGDAVAGGAAKIVLNTELRLSDPVLSWHAAFGAQRYDAVIEAEGVEVVRRGIAFEKSTVWEVEAADLAKIEALAPRGLKLRITAIDGGGNVVATSGDLPLTLSK